MTLNELLKDSPCRNCNNLVKFTVQGIDPSGHPLLGQTAQGISCPYVVAPGIYPSLRTCNKSEQIKVPEFASLD